MPLRFLQKSGFLAFVLTFISFLGLAQRAELRGKIQDESGHPIQFINVFIKELNQGAVTDSDGEFKILNLPQGRYEVTISGIGYKTQVVTATVPGNSLHITIAESSEQLAEITVEGKSETQLIKEQSIKAEVINLKAVSTQPSTMIEMINRSAGVRVRQMGGLGSFANLTVNGFQDRSIKYFRDGIPMDYLGAGYNFALVPVNMLDRLEIYKGVLPVSLGADALGGGLNMVTKKSFKKYVEASYEIASFNTHRASLNAFYQDTTRHFFVGGDAFFNHSDNDYEVTVEMTNPETRTQYKDKVNLFHNRFTHYYAELYGGVVNTVWADELRLGLTGFHIDRENQYGSRMTRPFGASTSRQYSLIPTVQYKKSFFGGKLKWDQFLVANTIYVEQVDTTKGSYNWYGEFKPPTDASRGEMSTRGSLSKVGFSYFISRSNFSYQVNSANRLELNVVHSRLSREGSDPLGLTFVNSGRDILSVPARYDKTIAALGLQTDLWDGRVVNNVIGKFFYAETHATDGDYYGNELERDAFNKRWGVAEAVKFVINDASFLRFSAEVSTRLPEQDEIFGDGNLHVSNFELKPERSLNGNLGYRRESRRYSLELNSFYRITDDLILNMPYNFLFNQHQNVDHVKGIGFEADATFAILDWLKVNGNFTYQDFRLFDTENSTKEDARLTNTPFFFANLGLNAIRTRLFHEGDKLQAYWYFSFVREYYLDYLPKDREPDGFLGLWGKANLDAPNIIPNQSTHTLGITYSPFGNDFTVGMQCKNIFDAEVFDNFRIQNAGRSCHFKLTYIFN
jgi:outer membrane cobalamin receptor